MPNKLFRLGLALLFFLPVIESFDRKMGMALLLFGSIFVRLPFIDKKKLEFDVIEKVFLIILTIFSISTIFSWSTVQSFTELLRYIAYFLIFISFRRVENKDKLIEKYFIPVIIINSFILICIFLLYNNPLFKLSPPETQMNLFYSTYRHNRISDILILAIPLSFGLFHMFLKKRYQILAPLITTLLIISLILSMGLGAILSLAFAFFIYVFLNQKIVGKVDRTWERLIAVFGLIAVIFVLSSFIFSNFIIKENQKDGLLKGFIKPLRTELRLEYFRQAIEGFKISPIMGTGLDTFRYVSQLYQPRPGTFSWYVHNHYIEIFQSTGFIGGIIFLIFVSILLIRSSQSIFIVCHNQYHYFRSTIYVGLLASTILGFMDYNFQYISIYLYWFMGMALLMPSAKSGKKNLPLMPFILLIIMSFSFYTFLLPDSDSVIKTAEKYWKNSSSINATNLLERYLKMDRYNIAIVNMLKDINLENKNYDEVHKWYQYALYLQPVNPEKDIRNDFLLYIKEAQTALGKNDIDSAFAVLNIGSELYPVFKSNIGKNDYLLRAHMAKDKKDFSEAIKILNEYIKKLKQTVSKNKIEPNDIKIIMNINRKTAIVY